MFPAVALAAFAATLATPAPPCTGAPLPPAADSSLAAVEGPRARIAAGARARPTTQPAADPTLPIFQVVGPFWDMAVLEPHNLLTPAIILNPDDPFYYNVDLVTGLAPGPAGKFWIVGNASFPPQAFLGLVDWNTGEEHTIGATSPSELIVDIAVDGAGNLYGLTANFFGGTDLHSLVSIDTKTVNGTVATKLLKVLDAHGGTGDGHELGALAYNSADGNFYYADRDASGFLFIDRLAPGTWTQTPVAANIALHVYPEAMAILQGKLWLFGGGSLPQVYSADLANVAGTFTHVGYPQFPTLDGGNVFLATAAIPNTLPCVPSTTAACLFNRFRVEVTYDATPSSGTGPATVVLESTESVKFSFFSSGNIEMILKILNGCGLNGKWWVFGGGLTDVGVTIKVTDTVTGTVQSFSSTKGHLFQPFAATSAFACP
jgi:hypothetical protein